MRTILKEISHFKYNDNLKSTGGTRFQANHADNRIRVIDVAICETSKAICYRRPDGRILTGLCRRHSGQGWDFFHRWLEVIRAILVLDPLPDNVSQIDEKGKKRVSSYWAWSSELRLC